MTELAAASPTLTGVRVIDLTRLLPGNYASLMLYGLGAEVIKVEELAGDGTRAVPPYAQSGESGANIVLNRGKASIALDLKSEGGREVLLRLIATADVLLDSFRPGVMDRLGLAESDLATAKPTLVHVSLTAFGSLGPQALLPAHDLNAESLAGLLSLSSGADGAPSMPGVPIADLATGLQAALAVVAGLRVAAQPPYGYRAEVSMMGAALSLTSLAAGHVAAGGGSVPSTPDLLTGGLACYRTYECADGKWVAVGALEPKFFTRIAALLGQPGWSAMQYDMARQAELQAQMAALFAQRSRDEWCALLTDDDTCVTPVYDIAEAFAAAAESTPGATVQATRADGSAATVSRAVPWLPEPQGAQVAALSADAQRLLAELGYSEAERAALSATKSVGGLS